MPFEKGVTPTGAIPYEKGQSGNPKGYTPGVKNRSTIARKVLEMTALYPTAVLSELQKQYPEITSKTTAEEMMTIIQVNKAIQDQDSMAYKNVLDSAYGAPKQEIDQTITGQIGIHITDKDAKLGG